MPRTGLVQGRWLAAGEDTLLLRLIDDRAGHRVAVDLGLRVIGALAVLVCAKQMGKLEHIRPLVEHLLASGYFLSDKVVEEALKQVGE